VSYAVKEIYYTLQGEGANTGRAAVFCRFAGCNLWSGRESDRGSAVCTFCDTDFVGTDGPGGGRFATPDALADAIANAWPARDSVAGGAATDASESNRGGAPRPLVVCTGGEPLLQMDEPLIDALHERGFAVAVETNGTRMPPAGLDWICVSPKAEAQLVLERGDELKLVYPQQEPEAQPECFESLEFVHFFLQPMDGPERERNTRLAIEYCLANPKWRLSVQTHKLVGLR
jgi:7-carboxy-7-deazaguanine synthase (Cx14CxxC type)